MRSAALTNRADLLAALARYAASQSALQLEIARQYPDLQIGPGYKWDQGANKWSLGISLTLPLFNQNQGQIAQAKAQRELAAAQFIALQARDIAQTEHALAGYRAALATLDAAQSLAATQQSRTQSAQRQFSSGYIDRSALDQAQLQALAAENTRLTASIQARQALGALEDAVERPLDGAIEISALPAPARRTCQSRIPAMKHKRSTPRGPDRGGDHVGAVIWIRSTPTQPASPPDSAQAATTSAGTVALSPEQATASGIEVQALPITRFQPQTSAYASVLDPGPLLQLRGQLRSAQLQDRCGARAGRGLGARIPAPGAAQ